MNGNDETSKESYENAIFQWRIIKFHKLYNECGDFEKTIRSEKIKWR